MIWRVEYLPGPTELALLVGIIRYVASRVTSLTPVTANASITVELARSSLGAAGMPEANSA